MERPTTSPQRPLCPSAAPDWDGSHVFGVVGGSAAEPRVGYLIKPQPATPDLLGLTGLVSPTKVLRMAAPCAHGRCQHFDGVRDQCRLAAKLVRQLPQVADRPPPCRIRPECRWWQQEGKAACLRCPQVVTETDGDHASAAFTAVADPAQP